MKAHLFDDQYTKSYDIIEIENFIKENNHLPWLTPADEEQEGINMTRMTFETLEAVENIQIQVIELKKQLNLAMEIIEKQNKTIKKLKTNKNN